jgi:hypothetical protein
MVKKAQIKIQQMAFMLIAVFILFVMIGIIVVAVKSSNLKKTATEYQQKNALTLVSKLASSPEFSCGNSYGIQKTDCIDLDKVMGLKRNIDNYEGFWEVSNIEIRKIYPAPSEEIKCDFENYPNCNYIDLMENPQGNAVSNFVSLCHKESNGNIVANVCDLGKIIVSYEAIQ